MNDNRCIQATLDAASVNLQATITQTVFYSALLLHLDAPKNTPFRKSVDKAKQLLAEFEVHNKPEVPVA